MENYLLSNKYESFGLSLDRLALLITCLCWLIILVISVILLLTEISRRQFVIVILILLPPIILTMLQPRSYCLVAKSLIIRRFLYNTIIPLDDMLTVSLMDYSATGRQYRLFASGGFGGYFGIFSSEKLGRLNYQATRRDSLVLIYIRGRMPLVVSPNEPEKFISAINSKRIK